MWQRARTIRPGPWPFPRPRVLIEHSDESIALEYSAILRRAGYSVGHCVGPSESRYPPERCVLVKDGRCLAVDGAEVVVSALGAGAPEKQAVIEALRRLHPDRPLVVEVSADEVDAFGGLIDGLHLIVTPVQPEELVAAVDDAAQTD